MRTLTLFAALAVLGACTRGPVARPPAPTLPTAALPRGTPVVQAGLASWYGPGFQGKPTTSGELYDQNALTAAHKTLPLGTRLRVTNVANDKTVEVRVNDRGPFVADRIIDLSFAAASTLGMVGRGVTEVVLEVIESPVAITAVPVRVRYAVQVGAYTARETAEAARERVSKEAKHVAIVSAVSGSRTLYRVRVGDFSDIDDAKAEAQRLKRAGVEGVVVER